MTSWREERRLDEAAASAQRREDRRFEATHAREERRRDREERRQEQAQRRRDRAQRRQARAQRREKQLAPGNVYRKGTLALVATSAAAALPAQIAYFVAKSLWLLPVPFALEGAAWVMAAGVAHADERKLPAWVRWLLRALSMTAAAFAARINYLHGSHEAGEAVGWGLAAVTMLGPMFFEVRQWVLTLSASTANPRQQAEDRARSRHERRRRRHHKDVCKLADKLVSASPYGTLKPEDAFAQAWLIVHGTDKPGWKPKHHAQAAASATALAGAQQPAKLTGEEIRGRILTRLDAPAFVLPTPPGARPKGIKKPQVASEIPPASSTPSDGGAKKGRKRPPPYRRTKGDSKLTYHQAAKSAAADTARKHATVNGHH